MESQSPRLGYRGRSLHQKDMPHTSAIAFLVLSTPFVAFSFYAICRGIHEIRMTTSALHWPVATGTLLSCRLGETFFDDDTTYYVDACYEYSVEGVKYQSTRIAYGYSGSSDKEYHERLLTKITETDTPMVRYDPSTPSSASLAAGFDRSLMFLPALGVTLLIFVIGLNVVAWNFFHADDALIESIQHR